MGYVADRSLAELFPESFVEDAPRRIADAVQDAMHEGVRDRTPVAQTPVA